MCDCGGWPKKWKRRKKYDDDLSGGEFFALGWLLLQYDVWRWAHGFHVLGLATDLTGGIIGGTNRFHLLMWMLTNRFYYDAIFSWYSHAKCTRFFLRMSSSMWKVYCKVDFWSSFELTAYSAPNIRDKGAYNKWRLRPIRKWSLVFSQNSANGQFPMIWHVVINSTLVSPFLRV